MAAHRTAQQKETTTTALLTPAGRFAAWVQDPMNSVVAASVATMSTLGFVLSGSWFISLMLS
jgi:hypothetical protein